MLHKSNKLKIPEARHHEEMSKTDEPNYCLYCRMLGHPIKSCYIFKDVLQALIDANVLKLRPKQKKVTANMTSSVPLQFDRGLPLALNRVASIPKGKFRVINTDHHNEKEKGMVSITTP